MGTVELFLNHFLPEREESADEYEFPQYSDSPRVVYTKSEDALKECIAKKIWPMEFIGEHWKTISPNMLWFSS